MARPPTDLRWKHERPMAGDVTIHTAISHGNYINYRNLCTRMPWKSNGKNGQLHTSTTQKSNALQLINEIKSVLTTSQNQCKPIDRSMEIMPMHITIAPIKHWKLNEHYIPHLPAPTNKTWKKQWSTHTKACHPIWKHKKSGISQKKTPKCIKMRHLRWGVLFWLWDKFNLKNHFLSSRMQWWGSTQFFFKNFCWW